MLERLPKLEDVSTAFEALFYLVGSAMALLTALEYRRNSKRHRTQWLFELYQRFYGVGSDIKKSWSRMDERGLDPAKSDDMLNFFEFVAILRHRKELSSNEIEDMFRYPLKRIAADRDFVKYLEEYDYEHLRKLVDDLGYTGVREAAR